MLHYVLLFKCNNEIAVDFGFSFPFSVFCFSLFHDWALRMKV